MDNHRTGLIGFITGGGYNVFAHSQEYFENLISRGIEALICGILGAFGAILFNNLYNKIFKNKKNGH